MEISLKNGILDVSAFLTGASGCIKNHSPNFFNFNSLPYLYNPNARCPKWENFLSDVLPDEDVRLLLREWIGYNLIPDTGQQKFMIFRGEGANGKTVVCVVLRELLGTANVSAVTLEAFDPKRTFPLAATVGKLANIVEELNAGSKTEEGELKKFVSGALMTIERKHKDPFEFIPTARLTYATNVLPKFSDRSNGIWRRLLLIPFDVQIPEKSQDKGLVDPTYWQGELSGIFNWAVLGLKSLKQRRYFIEPAKCKDIKKEYQQNSNPARVFLEDCCELDSKSEISSTELYQTYAAHVSGLGHKPLGAQNFAQEVKKTFNVELSKNVRRLSAHRSRVWHGLRLSDLMGPPGIPPPPQIL